MERDTLFRLERVCPPNTRGSALEVKKDLKHLIYGFR